MRQTVSVADQRKKKRPSVFSRRSVSAYCICVTIDARAFTIHSAVFSSKNRSQAMAPHRRLPVVPHNSLPIGVRNTSLLNRCPCCPGDLQATHRTCSAPAALTSPSFPLLTPAPLGDTLKPSPLRIGPCTQVIVPNGLPFHLPSVCRNVRSSPQMQSAGGSPCWGASWTAQDLFGGWIFSRDTAGNVHERSPNEPCSGGRAQARACL